MFVLCGGIQDDYVTVFPSDSFSEPNRSTPTKPHGTPCSASFSGTADSAPASSEYLASSHYHAQKGNSKFHGRKKYSLYLLVWLKAAFTWPRIARSRTQEAIRNAERIHMSNKHPAHSTFGDSKTN